MKKKSYIHQKKYANKLKDEGWSQIKFYSPPGFKERLKEYMAKNHFDNYLHLIADTIGFELGD